MLDVTAVYTFWHLSSYVISRYWVVFSVHDDSIPFLELWAEPTEVASKPPQFMFPLAVCQHISPSLGKSMKTVWQIFWRVIVKLPKLCKYVVLLNNNSWYHISQIWLAVIEKQRICTRKYGNVDTIQDFLIA